ncbi:MAG: hypothetical protein ACR2HG_09360 [Pyrinomonadaceae bacterium]
MKQINKIDYLRRDELIYWIDKEFVQETAKDKIGRELSEDEIVAVTKSIEWGLWESVFEVTKIAIGLAVEDNK